MPESLMERFANPDFFAGLPLGEKLAGAGVTTLMGMGTTFVVLLLLWACIVVMSKAVARFSRPAADPAPAPAAKPDAPAAEDGALLAAVAMAAIAASEGADRPLVVRRIRRIAGPDNAWSGAGRLEHK